MTRAWIAGSLAFVAITSMAAAETVTFRCAHRTVG
jgi:hypothetical protein